MAKQRKREKCKELAQHRPLSKAFSQNDASFCTDPSFTKFFQSENDTVMGPESGASAAANTDTNLLHKIWQKLSTLDKIENKVDKALKRLDRLEQHAQDFSQDLEPSHHNLKEELLLTKEVIQDIIPNLPDFSKNGLKNVNNEDEEDHHDHSDLGGTFDEDTLQNFDGNGKDDLEPELFFMEEEMGDLCTSLHTPDSCHSRKSVDAMYLVDFPSSDRFDASFTPFSDTYDVVSPVGAPSEFYPNLSEISGSNDHDDFTVRGASIKDASEIGDEEDYEYYEDEAEEDEDSEDDYWRLCPDEQVNQYGMSTIQRTSMGLLEQMSRLQEELGLSTAEDEDTESTEENMHEDEGDANQDGYPSAASLSDVQVFLPDIDAIMQNPMEEDELEMPQSVADASDVADLEDIAVKLRHASKGEEEDDLNYMTIEEFKMISGGPTSKSFNESQASLVPRQMAAPSIHASPGLIRSLSGQSLNQKSSDDDSWERDDDSDEYAKEDSNDNGHSFHIHGMTNGSGYDGGNERTLSGPYGGEIGLLLPPNDFLGGHGNSVDNGRTASLMSEESVPFVTPLASYDVINYDHEGGNFAGGYVSEDKSVLTEKQNGETNINKLDNGNVNAKSNLDSIETNEQELDNVEQKPRAISEKIKCINAALAENWGLKTSSKRKSFIKKSRKSLERKSETDNNETDSNDNNGESVVSDSVLTIFEALKAFEKRSQQVKRKKTQLKRKISSVETHLEKASNAIKSEDVSSGSSSQTCHPDTSIDTKSEPDTVARQPIGIVTKVQKNFPTGFDEDVPQSQLLQEQQPLNQENGMGCHMGSKVNGMSDQEEGKQNRGDVFLNQVPPLPVVGDEEDDDEENPYAVVNGFANDEGNDTSTNDIQDREYAEPSFTEGPDYGYAEPQTHDCVDKEEESNSLVTDTEVELPGMITNGEETMPVKSVDTMANKNPVVNKPGCGDTTSSNSIQESKDNDYEIITPRPIQPNYAHIHKEVPLDVCENETNISKSATREVPLDSPDLIKTLPGVPLKTKVFQKTEEKMDWRKDVVEEKDKVQVVRNLLPSEIKKKQVGPTGIKVNKTNVTKPNTYNPPKPSQNVPQNTTQNSVNSPNVEVVHRPPGSRRARIIRSYLELERIKREGVNRADGKPIQISAPNLMALGSGMKSGGGVKGSDQMLEDMLNLQIMQAMGMNPHTIATPDVGTSSKTTPPVRPSHLDIPTPIKTTKPVPKQTPMQTLKQTPKQSPKLPSSRLQPSGPSHGIAKMLNRFGENTATTPKPASQSYLGSGKGLKKTPARNAFNIDVKNGEVDINISDNNRQFLMNKLAPTSRGKGSSMPRPSNSPSYNNNSSNTNSNNSRGLATTQGFESSIKPEGAIVLKNHGVREDEEKSGLSEIRRTDPAAKGASSVVEDSRNEKEEVKDKLVREETSDGARDVLSSSSSASSSSSPPPTSSASRDTKRTDDERIASASEEKVSVSNSYSKEDVSGQSEVVEEVEPSVLHDNSSTSSSSPSSSLSSASPPPSSSSQPASLPSKPSVALEEPKGESDSIETHSVEIDSEERDSVVSQEGSCHSDTNSETDREKEETPKLEEPGTESISEPVLEIQEDVERDADDEASKCESIQTKPIPAVRKGRPEAEASLSSSSSSSPSSSSASSSGTSSSGSSSELDEVTGQTKEKRRPKGLKEAMRRRAQLKASQLANESAKVEERDKTKEPQETSTQEVSSSESEGVKDEAKMEKVDVVSEGDNKNENNANLTARTVENLVVESKLEVKDSEDSSESSKQEDVLEALRKEDAGSGVEEERSVRDEEMDASSSGSRKSSSSSSSSVESEGTNDSNVDKTRAHSQDMDNVSKVNDTPAAVSSKVTMTLHSPVSSSTTFPISNSTSPSTSTSENISSVIEVTPRMSERVQSVSPSLTNSSSNQSQKASSSVGEDTKDETVLSVNKTDSNEPSAMKPMRSISSPGTSPSTPSIPRNFGHPFRFSKACDDNAILTPKKTTTSVKRSESAVSSLQSKRNKFLGARPRPDEDTSPTGSAPARSFKNVVSGSKFAALREKFSASNGNSNNNAGQGKQGGYSPSSPSTPKSLWQQKSPSSSSLYSGGRSITEDSSLNSSSEQKKSIYGTPPTSPPTPLPYKTPPESPLDLRNKTSPSAPMASSTPIGTAELKSPTAAELKRQFLFGADDSQQGDVFTEESGGKDENSNLKDISMAPIEQIEDEAALEKMLEEATEFDERKKIRSRLREVRKKKRDEREQKAQEQEKAFEEKMHKLEVESAQQRMRAVGLNVQSPGDRTKTVTETKDDGKTKTVVETTMRDSGSSKSVSMTISSKTEDEGFKSQSLQQESKSISVGPGGSSSVTMSKTVSSSSSSSTSTTDKPKGRPKTKFDEDMEKKKAEREEKRKQDEARFKEQQMQRKKEQYELKKKQAEDAKNRKAALFNKFGGPGGGGGGAERKPAGGGGTTMKVQNATTIKQKLLEWAQRVTRGYAGVNVTNFSSSWANGLAFCAVIHHYYPDAFDFNTLDPKQRRKNFDLAFNTAEEQADIMPLLDTDDMIMMKNAPDWKCVFTYVQSLYRHLNK